MTDLVRFVRAQGNGVYDRALAELRAGEKQSHWMWFVFPQISGLGRSEMARLYAISDRQEAQDYLAHPVLGPRLHECTSAMLEWAGRRTAQEILGPTDSLKFASSMTLFDAAAKATGPFFAALRVFFSGRRDRATLERL